MRLLAVLVGTLAECCWLPWWEASRMLLAALVGSISGGC